MREVIEAIGRWAALAIITYLAAVAAVTMATEPGPGTCRPAPIPQPQADNTEWM